MKANIKANKTYDITINGVVHCGFKKVSEWEGLIKFQNNNGAVIIDTITEFGDVIFIDDIEEVDFFNVVRASPYFA